MKLKIKMPPSILIFEKKKEEGSRTWNTEETSKSIDKSSQEWWCLSQGTSLLRALFQQNHLPQTTQIPYHIIPQKPRHYKLKNK